MVVVLLAAGALDAAALEVIISTDVSCIDNGTIMDADGGPAIPSAHCEYSVNRTGIFRRVGNATADAAANAGFRSVGVLATAHAALDTNLPNNFGGRASARAELRDVFIMDARQANGTPVLAGHLSVNLATTGLVMLTGDGQADLSEATLQYTIVVGGGGMTDLVQSFLGEPPQPVTAILPPIVVPWQAGLPIDIVMSAFASVDANLTFTGWVDVSADFGSTLRWLGISDVVDANGLPVASFTALSPDGADWGSFAPVPIPGAGVLLASALGILGWSVRARRRE